MEIPLFPSDQIPQPRAAVRIEDLALLIYPDRFRVRVHIVVTAFMERPNLILVIHDEQDQIVCELNIIETMHHDMEFTMHLRNLVNPADPTGAYTLTADLFYDTRTPPHDRRIEAFVIPPEA